MESGLFVCMGLDGKVDGAAASLADSVVFFCVTIDGGICCRASG